MQFTLHLVGCPNVAVDATTLPEACLRAGINPNKLALLESYEVDGQKTEVAGQSNCGCWYHAWDGLACTHDLERVGLTSQERPSNLISQWERECESGR